MPTITPGSGQLLLNNWILDETGDPILDESSDPVLDAVAAAPLVSQTLNAAISPAGGYLYLNVDVLTDEDDVPLTDEDGEYLTTDDESAPSVIATISFSPASANLVLSSVAPTVVITATTPALEIVGGGGGIFDRRPPRRLPRRIIRRPPAPVPVPISIVPPSTDLVLSSTAPKVFASNHLKAMPAAAIATVSLKAPAVIQTTNLSADELFLLSVAA